MSTTRPEDISPEKKKKNKPQEKLGKKVRKTSRKVKFILFLILVLAAILAYYFGYNYGLNLGSDSFNSDSTSQDLSSDTTDETDDSLVTDSNEEIAIRVKDDLIYLNEEVVTFEELSTIIETMAKENLSITVIDNVAIEATLNSVIDLLDQYEIENVIVEDGNLE
jgi:hypothetical protein